jgi:hypothetical protein
MLSRSHFYLYTDDGRQICNWRGILQLSRTKVRRKKISAKYNSMIAVIHRCVNVRPRLWFVSTVSTRVICQELPTALTHLSTTHSSCDHLFGDCSFVEELPIDARFLTAWSLSRDAERDGPQTWRVLCIQDVEKLIGPAELPRYSSSEQPGYLSQYSV